MLEAQTSKNRLENFFDAILAIIITITLLEIKAPSSEELNTMSFYTIFKQLAPQIISTALSFFTLVVYWLNHQEFMGFVKKTNRTFSFINLSMIFTLSLIPFLTSFLANAYSSTSLIFNETIRIYIFVSTLPTLLWVIAWFSAVKHDLLKDAFREIDGMGKRYVVNLGFNSILFLSSFLLPKIALFFFALYVIGSLVQKRR